MSKHPITFLPDKKTLEVNEGTTIAEAAQEAGIFLNNLCGGEGVCGECRVKVLKGNGASKTTSSAFFSKEEQEQGFVLACQTEISEPLEVEIPLTSRLEDAQIMTGSAQEDLDSQAPLPLLKPLVRKIYLELPAPTLDDNITDIERVSRELRRKLGWHSYDISFNCLKDLSNILRDHDWKVTATVVKDKDRYRIHNVEPGNRTQHNFGLAVDVGTTTVVVQLVDLRTGKIMAVDGTHNMQAQYGEDVISRMIYACDKDGMNPMHQAIVDNINELIASLAGKSGIPKEEITALVAAGNTTMSHFLLNLVPCSIRLEPYVPTADIYPQILAGDIGVQINPWGIMETMPSVSSYVGGDIVAGILAAGMADHSEVSALIDIGTNGEIAIGNNEWLVCCSASAGPAFEGGGHPMRNAGHKGGHRKGFPLGWQPVLRDNR